MPTIYDQPCLAIGGAARSGTTLLGKFIGSHPHAAILLEERLTSVVQVCERLASIRTEQEDGARHRIFGRATSFLSTPIHVHEEDVGRLASSLEYQVRFSQIFRHLFEATCCKTGAKVVGSKYIVGETWEDLELLVQRLSKLKILLIVRNPLSVISSSLVRGANAKLGHDVWSARTVEVALAEWLLSMRELKKILESCGVPLLVTKYEDLCAADPSERHKVISFAGLSMGGASEMLLPSLAADRRSGLTDVDTALVTEQIGDVDLTWNSIDAEDAVSLYGGGDQYVPIGSRQSFSEASSALMLINGFSYPEAWGRWTDGASASIRLRHTTNLGDLILRLEVVLAHAVPALGGTPITIAVNGRSLKCLTLPPGQSLDIQIPMSHQRTSGLLDIGLGIVRPATGDPTSSGDPRRLGLGLAALSLHLAPGR